MVCGVWPGLDIAAHELCHRQAFDQHPAGIAQGVWHALHRGYVGKMTCVRCLQLARTHLVRRGQQQQTVQRI